MAKIEDDLWMTKTTNWTPKENKRGKRKKIEMEK